MKAELPLMTRPTSPKLSRSRMDWVMTMKLPLYFRARRYPSLITGASMAALPRNCQASSKMISRGRDRSDR